MCIVRYPCGEGGGVVECIVDYRGRRYKEGAERRGGSVFELESGREGEPCKGWAVISLLAVEPERGGGHKEEITGVQAERS